MLVDLKSFATLKINVTNTASQGTPTKKKKFKNKCQDKIMPKNSTQRI
jgi:hypothetical protein